MENQSPGFTIGSIEKRPIVRVIPPITNGYTRVLVECYAELRPEVCFEVPNEVVPYHLREVGSRFAVSLPLPMLTGPEVEALSADELRTLLRDFRVEEL